MSRPDSVGTHQMRWQKALQARVRWTREAWIDRLVLANKSWSPDDLDVFWSQNRDPSNYPILHTVMEAICGLETQSRRDTSVIARTSQHQDTAQALSGLNKYVDGQAKADHIRSKAFRNGAGLGVGLTETFYSDDVMAESIGKRSVDPMHMWFDPAGREDDLSDYQDVFRARWMPKAWIDLRFGKVQEGAGSFAPIFRYDQLSYTGNRDGLATSAGPSYADEPSVSQFNGGMGGDPNFGPGHGLRAPMAGQGWATQDADNWWRVNRYEDLYLLVERWYRADEWAQFLVMRDGRVIEVTPEKARMCAQLLCAGKGKLVRSIARRIRCAIFIASGDSSGCLLQDKPSPYPHGMFPFVPTWGYRDEEGQPMGVVRLLRDAAREFNMRRTHLTKATLMRQVHVEDGAFLDEDEAIREIGKYNGVVKYVAGGMQRSKVVDNAGASAGTAALEASLLQGALAMVQNLGPVNQESLGQQTNADSGVAIEGRKQGAQTALAYLFDQRNLAQQVEGEQTIALIQDDYTEEKEVRINGSSTGLQYLHVNRADPTTGAVINDISQGRYDVIVSEQPEAPTLRAAKLDAVGKLFQGVELPAAVRLQLAVTMAEAQDLPVEVITMIKKAQEMASQPPEQAQQQEHRTLADVIRVDFPDLTKPERDQVLTQLGIQPDPNGGLPGAQEGQQVSADAALKSQTALAVQQAKNERDQAMLEAKHAHEHKGRLLTAAETAAARADQMAAAHAQRLADATQAGFDHRHEHEVAARQHQRSLELADQQAQQAPTEPPPQAGADS